MGKNGNTKTANSTPILYQYGKRIATSGTSSAAIAAPRKPQLENDPGESVLDFPDAQNLLIGKLLRGGAEELPEFSDWNHMCDNTRDSKSG
jgi:hypothetical protein